MTRFACGYGGCPLDGPHLHEHKPAVPATPTCACGKPGSYRGDPDKGYQTMKCPDCCARQEVVAAIKAAEPPRWIAALQSHLGAAFAETLLASENASCCVPWVREVVQQQMLLAQQNIERAIAAVSRGPKP